MTVTVEETTECYQLSESFLIETLGKNFKKVVVIEEDYKMSFKVIILMVKVYFLSLMLLIIY